MITENLMQLGQWDVQLKAETPMEIKQRFKFGGNIIITPTEIHDHLIGRDALAAAARYTGLIWRKNMRKGHFGGVGMLGYLATGQGEAGKQGFALFGPLSLPDTFWGIVGQMFTGGGYTNGITPGVDYGSTATQVNEWSDFILPPCKGPLDTFAAQTGNEYRITPAGKLDASPAGLDSNVFQVTDPWLILSPLLEGRDGIHTAVHLTEWDVERQIDNYRASSFVVDAAYPSGSASEGAGYPTFQSADEQYFRWGSSTFLGGDLAYYFNDPLRVDVTTDFDDMVAISNAIANRYALAQHEITCSTDEPSITKLTAAGNYVWVYDPYEGLVDLANSIPWKGRTIHPVKLRLPGMTWPIRRGMGVYVYYDDVVTNVTRWVEFEDDTPCSLEIGSLPLPLVPSKFASLVD